MFYTTVRATMDGHLLATVNGKRMMIDEEVWDKFVGLSCSGIKKYEETPNGYSKMGTYKSILLNPAAQLRNRLGVRVGGLTTEDMMVEYLITYVLTPRARNHAQVTNDDLQLMHGLKTCQRMN